MSALHHGRVEVVTAPGGRMVYTATTVEPTLIGTAGNDTPVVYIPPQRRPAHDLSNQSGQVQIPSFGVFVQETLAKQTAKEA